MSLAGFAMLFALRFNRFSVKTSVSITSCWSPLVWMDKIHFTPPKNPRNGQPLANTNKNVMVSILVSFFVVRASDFGLRSGTTSLLSGFNFNSGEPGGRGHRAHHAQVHVDGEQDQRCATGQGTLAQHKGSIRAFGFFRLFASRKWVFSWLRVNKKKGINHLWRPKVAASKLPARRGEREAVPKSI